MTRPLTGMREVFRRLDEREEGRARRRYEQEELMGIEHEQEQMEYWRSVDIPNTYDWQRQMQQQMYNAFRVPEHSMGNNIRGARANYAWLEDDSWGVFDSYFGESRGRAPIEQVVEAVVRMVNGSEYTVSVPRPSPNHVNPHETIKIYTSSRRSLFHTFGFNNVRGINDFFTNGGVFWNPFERRVVRTAVVYKSGEEETVVFGTKESFVRQLMEERLLEFFGMTKQQIKAQRLIEARASMKSFAKLLLRKEKF